MVTGNCLRLLPLACSLVFAAPSKHAGGKVTAIDVDIPPTRHDDQYYTVTLDFNGQKLPVLLDSGSADIMVASNECNNVKPKSGCYKSKQYKINNKTKILKNETSGSVVGVGSVNGNQSIMSVGFGSITATKLATPLLYYADQNEFQNGSFSGILGVAPRNVSREYYFNHRLPPIDAMISKALWKKPVFSLSLPRLGDPKSPKTGKLTLGEIENIHTQNNITYNPIIDVPNYNYKHFPLAPQSWNAVLQGVRVNGKEIKLSKGVIDKSGRYLSDFDSGGQKLQFRPDDFDSISKLFKGKTIVHPGHDVYFECSIPQLFELKYHGKWFPVDPLDLIIPSDHGLVNGTQMCHAALDSWDRAFADSIIGVPFLRNVLAVFDYVTPKLYERQPRFGLGSTTNKKEAMARYAKLYKNRLL